MADDQMNVLCKNCGQAFTVFLKEMADHNEKVVCPCCGASGETLETELKKHTA